MGKGLQPLACLRREFVAEKTKFGLMDGSREPIGIFVPGEREIPLGKGFVGGGLGRLGGVRGKFCSRGVGDRRGG